MAALPEIDTQSWFRVLESNLHSAVLQIGELPPTRVDEEKEVGTHAFGNRH